MEHLQSSATEAAKAASPANIKPKPTTTDGASINYTSADPKHPCNGKTCTEDQILKGGKTRTAHTLFTSENLKVARELVDVMEESRQEIPDALRDLAELQIGPENSQLARQLVHAMEDVGQEIPHALREFGSNLFMSENFKLARKILTARCLILDLEAIGERIPEALRDLARRRSSGGGSNQLSTDPHKEDDEVSRQVGNKSSKGKDFVEPSPAQFQSLHLRIAKLEAEKCALQAENNKLQRPTEPKPRLNASAYRQAFRDACDLLRGAKTGSTNMYTKKYDSINDICSLNGTMVVAIARALLHMNRRESTRYWISRERSYKEGKGRKPDDKAKYKARNYFPNSVVSERDDEYRQYCDSLWPIFYERLPRNDPVFDDLDAGYTVDVTKRIGRTRNKFFHEAEHGVNISDVRFRRFIKDVDYVFNATGIGKDTTEDYKTLHDLTEEVMAL